MILGDIVSVTAIALLIVLLKWFLRSFGICEMVIGETRPRLQSQILAFIEKNMLNTAFKIYVFKLK